MVPEFWRLGEDLQDRIRAAGYDAESVEGIAVDIHDLLQAAERIRAVLVPAALSGEDTATHLRELEAELAHIRWHTLAAEKFLTHALTVLVPASEQPL